MRQHLLLVAMISLTGCDSKEGGASASSKTTSSPPPAAASACPGSYSAVPEAQRGGPLTCACAAEAVRGSVWGSGVYTADSSICAAARHAGAVGATGGDVTVQATTGCPAYGGSAANGITTGSWGAFDKSFYFPSKGDGKCPAPAAEACPPTWDRVPNATTTAKLTCSCATIPASGAVYGTGMYTSDSSICRAAVHAGAIPASGGTVTVVRAAGCPSFKNTEQHGISSASWGSYPLSYFFEGHGGGC